MNLLLGACGEGSETLLHGEFGAYPPKGTRYALSLTRTELHIQRLVPKPDTDHRTVVRLVDVVGCHTMRSHTVANSSAFFCVYSYPLKKKKVAVGSGRARQRVAKTFQVDSSDRYEDNLHIAEKWAAAIKCLVLGISVSSETEISRSLLPRPRRLLLLLNPFGGKGNALQWCQNHILPMITEADVSFNLIQTERQNHARELVQSISLAEWDGIVAISGDGLLYEVINGLMERPDWEEAIKMPLGILPCGSGNAVAAAINFNAGFDQTLGQELLTNCTLLLCHGAVSPLDLVSITTSSGSRSFSFLSVAWGFISDVDIESEKYRHMGSARFTLGTMVRLASLNTYRGRLSYLPAPDSTGHRPILRSITMAANGSLPFQRMPLHRTVSDMGLCEERRTFCYRGLESADEPAPSPNSPPPSSGFPTSAFSFETLSEQLVADGLGAQEVAAPTSLPSSTRQMRGPPDNFLAPLDQPVPKSWVTVEDDFVLVLAIYQTHLGADLFAAPFACFNDGLIHLAYVKAGISRAALIRLFLAMEKGTHFEQGCPHVTNIPVRAFRIEPLTHKGIITVDGERVEYGPIQGQIHHGVANLITGISPVKITKF
ncbi:sphingosine kinase 2 [Anolis carolinensis]|uniref:sphingosine kinase 2 n=1 Tax=Anolis carolinensis TaxID=28377 RepID=UPI000462889D|nr:PREDICTED: sphingosine kinase 2 isoform X1 [Anolis carolinensis]|eukprot:XP_008115402.1 PREDICTED: sphingosine kinase 2 isoform X1 [Anolis carolinensis]